MVSLVGKQSKRCLGPNGLLGKKDQGCVGGAVGMLGTRVRA